MRNGCNVFDHVDFQTRGLQAADGGLTPGTGALDIDLDSLEAKLHGGLCGGLSSHLSGKGRGLLASTEAQAAGAGPAEGVAVGVGQGNDGIVKGRTDMRGATLDELLFTALARYLLKLLLGCHVCSSLHAESAYFASG